MVTVLGIDAAWTATQPSGVALVRRHRATWRGVGVAPSYGQFIDLAHGRDVDRSVRAPAGPPDAAALLTAATQLLGGEEVTVVAVDMPLATVPITGRRVLLDRDPVHRRRVRPLRRRLGCGVGPASGVTALRTGAADTRPVQA